MSFRRAKPWNNVLAMVGSASRLSVAIICLFSGVTKSGRHAGTEPGMPIPFSPALPPSPEPPIAIVFYLLFGRSLLRLNCGGMGPFTDRRSGRRPLRACGMGCFYYQTLDRGTGFSRSFSFLFLLFFFLLSSSPMISFDGISSTSSPSSSVSCSLGSFSFPRSGRWRLGSRMSGISPNESSKTSSAFSSCCSGCSTMTLGASFCLMKP